MRRLDFEAFDEENSLVKWNDMNFIFSTIVWDQFESSARTARPKPLNLDEPQKHIKKYLTKMLILHSIDVLDH